MRDQTIALVSLFIQFSIDSFSKLGVSDIPSLFMTVEFRQQQTADQLTNT